MAKLHIFERIFCLSQTRQNQPSINIFKTQIFPPRPPETFLKNLPQVTSKITAFWNQELSPHSMNLCSDYLSEI